MEWSLFADGTMQNMSEGRRKYWRPGGWAAIMTNKQEECGLSEAAMVHSQDSMELKAVVEGLQWIIGQQQLSPSICIHSDSMYVLQVILSLLDERERRTLFGRSQICKPERKGYMIENPSLVHEEDDPQHFALQGILRKCSVSFIQIAKLTAPVEHMRCHAIADQARLRFAEEMRWDRLL